MQSWPQRRDQILFAATTLLSAGGLVLAAGGAGSAADGAWVAATLIGLGYSTATLVAAVRRREASVDVIAWLALAGALAVGEALAGAVVAVMLATGVLLEARAAARARRELSALAARAPRTARRDTAAGPVEVPVAEVVLGDRLLVGSGEIVPVDGRLLGPAVLDESALTGEPLPVERRAGEDVRSGVVNAGGPVRLTATATAEASTYAGVVRLVGQAQAQSAPFVRIADRFAVAFVPLTLLLAAGAWAVAGDPVRAVAVLVVATPCPLLLAAPIAIISGISRAARRGVIVKGGGALERLAAGRVLLFDKTGTLTAGRPALTDVVTPTGGDLSADDVLRLAASLDQSSAHVLAGAIVTAARDRRLPLTSPGDVHERHGHGVEGVVDGRHVRLGKASSIVTGPMPAWMRHARRRAALDGSLTVFAAVDGVPAGVLLLEDQVRPQAPRMVRALRRAGITRVVLITGDHTDTAEAVGRVVGVDAVHADCDPADKLTLVGAEQDRAPTIMVGDGINDAPALAAAGVGVALAARGASASSEAADVVLTVDRLDALADAILIARRCRRIALWSVAIGMGLSGAAMAVAAAGYLTPVAGAVLQEIIDLAAIAIAMTALLPGRSHTVTMPAADLATARRLYAEHQEVRPLVEQVRTVADALNRPPYDLGPVRELLDRLQVRLLAHERAEEAELLPIMARALGGTEATSGLSRTHAEIEHQIGRLRRAVEEPVAQAEAEDVTDVRRLLYGLYAILRLHNAQEEEGAFSLVADVATP
ncbi:heavy metal translocating P-type ATPase [Pseudosporangium ferrugineum]|uniref:P-type E1-E2 ATPase/heavy metal translocating P-type ATPase n=1 Tax=Pseudosporangium ferrugineum TaxID=439699 RepID=A0A2T0SB65_9ACTN|nr:heavy metal translocating P-type ATPase [Pseudosporangium ferrugineum]PRY30621.1 P-type E1-E2 ATPase/heavy metal translocating P-type ATPase [Pseudosporangium ferrugineum]